MAQLADKTGISRLSNQHTPEYLCKAKPAKYLCSRHKYLLLRVRSYPQIMLIIAVPPRSARARALPPQQVLHRGTEQLRRVCPRLLGLCAVSIAVCPHRIPISARYYQSDITPE